MAKKLNVVAEDADPASASLSGTGRFRATVGGRASDE